MENNLKLVPLEAGKGRQLEQKPIGNLVPPSSYKPDSNVSTNTEIVNEVVEPFSPESFFEHVADREGSGDTATSVPTAHYGVTEAAAKDVGETFEKDMSKEKARLISMKYISGLENKFANKVEGWDFLPIKAREAAVDAAYNMGPQVYKFKGFISELENVANGSSDIESAAKLLLDTANINGRSSRGLARRRAELYNQMLGESVIDTIVQGSGGKIRYLSGGDEVFSYTPKSGIKHKSSKVGSLDVETGEELPADGWYKDTSTGEKFQVKNGRRL